DRHPALPVGGRGRAHPGLRPQHPGHRLGRGRRAGPPHLPDRRPRGRRCRAHGHPRLAGPAAHPPVLQGRPAPGPGPRGRRHPGQEGGAGAVKIVAVTSCPTGIAHTYMAAEALEQAAKDAGHEIKVETQGAAGAEAVPDADIAAADAVVFAADVEGRNRERFAGKPLVQTSVKRAINDAEGLIAEAEAAARSGARAGGGEPGALADAAAAGTEEYAMETAPHPETKVDRGAGLGTRLRQW